MNHEIDLNKYDIRTDLIDETIENNDIDNINVKEENGQLIITNTHIGSLGDILTYVVDVAPELNISKVQLLDAILQEMSKGGFSEQEECVFWNDFDNLQKAKIVR